MKIPNNFVIKQSDVDRIAKSIAQSANKQKELLEKKMQAIVAQVYTTAHAKRPMITAKMAKTQGRSKRVSDPTADYGVPVDTGALQSSIKTKIVDNGKSITGSIYVDSGSVAAEYAKFIEFGTSRMPARPFMRPALMLNEEWIKAIFQAKG